MQPARNVPPSCRESAESAAYALEWARRRAEAAVPPVLAGAVDRLVADADTMRAQLDSRYALLTWIERVLPPGDPARKRVSLALPPAPPPGSSIADYRALPAPPEWLAAVDALLVDADAKLPA